MIDQPTYRVFDKKWDCMYDEECISYSYGDWELQRLFENGDKAECVEIDNEEVILMMYTGFKHEGKYLEWWEGDILYLKDDLEDKSVCVIVRHLDGFKKQYYTDGKPSIQDDIGEVWFSPIDALDKEMYKKVGNIHENPEKLIHG